MLGRNRAHKRPGCALDALPNSPSATSARAAAGTLATGLRHACRGHAQPQPQGRDHRRQPYGRSLPERSPTLPSARLAHRRQSRARRGHARYRNAGSRPGAARLMANTYGKTPRYRKNACRSRAYAHPVAEREGFEPSMGSRPYTLSRRAPSAARTPLRCDRSTRRRTPLRLANPTGRAELAPRERRRAFRRSAWVSAGGKIRTSPRLAVWPKPAGAESTAFVARRPHAVASPASALRFASATRSAATRHPSGMNSTCCCQRRRLPTVVVASHMLRVLASEPRDRRGVLRRGGPAGVHGCLYALDGRSVALDGRRVALDGRSVAGHGGAKALEIAAEGPRQTPCGADYRRRPPPSLGPRRSMWLRCSRYSSALPLGPLAVKRDQL